MLLLTNGSAEIDLVTSAAAQIDVHASYVDLDILVVTPKAHNSKTTTATTTTIVGSPSAGQRNVKTLSFRNADPAASNTLTIEHNDGSLTVSLFSLVLLAGYELTWTDEEGWELHDTTGAVVTTTSSSPTTSFVVVTHAMSPYAASADTSLVVDVSGGAVTVTLPSLATGHGVGVKHGAGDISVNPITVQGTGQNLESPPAFNPGGIPTFGASVVLGGAQATGVSYAWKNAGLGAGLSIF